MHSKKRTVKNIINKYKIDPDSLLISLWSLDNYFEYLKNDNSIIRTKDLKFIREFLSNYKYKEKDDIKINILIENKGGNKNNYDFSIGKRLYKPEYITKDEVLKIYEELVFDFNNNNDPIYPYGLRDDNLLESALFHCKTSYNGNLKYKSIESIAATLMYSLSHNHPFYNGNKRTAVVSMLVFLDRHSICLTCDDNDLFIISLKVADHKILKNNNYKDAEIYELTRWIIENSRKMIKGERVVTLKKFKQILTGFDCEICENGKIERYKKTFLGFRRKLASSRKISNTLSDGSNIDREFVRSVRRDLELTPEYGIDSYSFYSKIPFSGSDFIVKYKNLLRRLSKV